MDPLNRKRYQQFKVSCLGARIFSIHVRREDRGGAIVMKYNGRSEKGKLFNGEWTIRRGGLSDAELQQAIDDFHAMLAGDFHVTRHDGGEAAG